MHLLKIQKCSGVLMMIEWSGCQALMLMIWIFASRARKKMLAWFILIGIPL